MEDNTELRKNNIFYLSLLVISIMSIIFAILLKNKILSIIMLIIFFGTTSILLINIYVNKSFKNHNKKVEVIKRNINQIENDLNYYCKELQINDYKELFKKLKIYDDYRKLEVKINEKIKDKLLQKKLLDLDKAINEYEIINKDINRYLTISRVDNLEKLINDVNKYEESYKGLDILEIEMKNLKIGLERIIEQLEIREQKIKAKLKIIGFENIDLLEVEDILNELEEKLKLREEINKSLASVEETYSVLTKGKNIDLIKKELADVININFKYSYENEEEIDSVIKQKNLRLLSVEKKIKDVENEIKNRFNGKRTIPDIEEEIKFVEGKIIKNEKQFEATKIALNVLEESYQEIRKSFGPTLNKNVIDSFSKFTDGKYNDVMVADNYEMKVRNKNNIFQAETLSNGANDQLNLSLRLAFIEMIFKSKEISIYLDDAFVQYDDKRTERTIKHLVSENFKQCIIFTCQNREENIVRKGNIKYKYIKLTL